MLWTSKGAASPFYGQGSVQVLDFVCAYRYNQYDRKEVYQMQIREFTDEEQAVLRSNKYVAGVTAQFV